MRRKVLPMSLRAAANADRHGNRPKALDLGRAPRVMHDAICASCGQPTQVPFKPREDRPGVTAGSAISAQRLAGGEF